MSLYAPEAVTIPGAVDAFCNSPPIGAAWTLRETLAPAIHYAEEGVPVAPRVAKDCGLRQSTCCKAAPAKPCC